MDNNKKKVIIGVGILAGAGLAYLLTRKAGGGGQPEGLELSNLSITPTTVAPGEPVTISVLVTNHTRETLGFVVNLTGDFIDSFGGFLDAGQSKTAVFTVTPTMEKTYNVKVDGLSGSFLCTNLPHGDIVLSNLIITPNPCTEGDTVTISVTATNQGTTNQSMMVTLRLAGDKYNDSSQQVHQIVLSPGASQVITFTFRPTVDETYQVTVDGLSGSLVVNPGPSWPGWTEDTVVLDLHAEPETVFLGESTSIHAYIMGPWPADYEQGVMIEATIDINGEMLSKTFFTHIRNPTLYFNYTPTATGTFTVTAQDKTAQFTVVANPISTYYSPFGGTRMPIITDIVIPDVDPFTYVQDWNYVPGPNGQPVRNTYNHPGGDLIYSDFFPMWDTFRVNPPRFSIEIMHTNYPLPASLVAKFPYSSPVAWTPAGASIATWNSELSHTEGPYGEFLHLKFIPLDFTCQPYWDSKEELMEMIAVSGKGLNNPQVPIAFKSDYSNEVYHYYIFCPYCHDYIATGSATHQQNSTAIREKSARYLISHIETSHPTHLLTEPAWF